jgi:hypothetical protein
METTLPTGVATLDELLTVSTTSDTPVKVFVGHNLGSRTFLFGLPMYEFYRMSDVANERGKNGEPVAQRKLDVAHAHKLAVYILRGLVGTAIRRREKMDEGVPAHFIAIQHRLGIQPYLSLQPIVANLRSVNRDGSNVRGSIISSPLGEAACFKVLFSQADILWIVDGQHRRKAMDLVFEFLDFVRMNQRYPKKRQSLFSAESDDVSSEELQVWSECYEVARSVCTVTVELHLGLGIDEERQLFHDLNNLAKKVETSLALEFDSANPINAFIKTELVGTGAMRVADRDVVNWQDDDGRIARKDLVAVNAHLFLNKTNINGAAPPIVDARKPVAMRFWTAICAIPNFGESGAKQRTVAAQPVVLKALAKLTYDFAFGKHQSQELLDRLLDGVTDIDFSHENPMWRFYQLTDEERREAGLHSLRTFLPSDDEGKNRDVGAFDTKAAVMRFGAKHNDIFPIIGDMIRWKLGLPNRHDKGEQLPTSAQS